MLEECCLFAPIGSSSPESSPSVGMDRGGANRNISRRVGGHAHIYGVPTNYVAPGRRLKVLPGAFAESIRTRNVFMLYQHDRAQPLLNTSSGLLRVTDTQKSVQFVANLPATGLGDHVYELIRLGVLQSMSIKLAWLREDATDERKDGDTITVIRRAVLWEVSPVTWPSQQETSVGVLLSRHPEHEDSELSFIHQRRWQELDDPGYRRRVHEPVKAGPTVRELYSHQLRGNDRTSCDGQVYFATTGAVGGMFG
jgi:HK97 family phage prohead protease